MDNATQWSTGCEMSKVNMKNGRLWLQSSTNCQFQASAHLLSSFVNIGTKITLDKMNALKEKKQLI